MKITRNTKVLFIPVWYPSKFNKVGGIFVKQHALALNNKVKLAVFHVCPQIHLNALYKFEQVNEEEILVFRIYFYAFSIRILRPLNLLLYFPAALIGYFKTIKRFGKPHLNHVHVLTRAGVLAGLMRCLHGTPYFISEHWSRYIPERNSYKGFLRKLITRLIVKKSAGISAVSQNLKLAIQSHHLDHLNFPIIPNTVNFNLFRQSAHKEKSRVFRFLHVSGLTDKIKNISGILKACAILAEKRLKFELYIIGEDSKKQKLKDFKNKLNLSKIVFFKGELTGDALVQEYQQADAFILFSFFENQPCVLLESFSCGLPVIATKAGGIPEIINSKNGRLVSPGDPAALAKLMEEFIRESISFDGNEIRNEAENLYSYPAAAEKIINFYSYRIK